MEWSWRKESEFGPWWSFSSGENAGGDNHGDKQQFHAIKEMVYDVIKTFVNVPNVNANMEN